MAKPGRKAFVVPTTPWKISIPVPLAAEIELRLFDPKTGVVEYGARSALVERLLRQWIEQQKHNPTTPTPTQGDTA